MACSIFDMLFRSITNASLPLPKSFHLSTDLAAPRQMGTSRQTACIRIIAVGHSSTRPNASIRDAKLFIHGYLYSNRSVVLATILELFKKAERIVTASVQEGDMKRKVRSRRRKPM